jgi:hypothetical protein
MLSAIPDLFADQASTVAAEALAVRNTATWSKRNVGRLQSAFETLKSSPEFLRYTDVPVEIWEDQASRLGGAFDARFAAMLAAVLNVPIGELNSLQLTTSSSQGLRKTYSRLMSSELGMLLAKSYAVSLLIRGRYHEYLAQAMDQQIIHHPMRDGVLPRARTETEYGVSNVIPHLCAIALGCGRRERVLDARIKAWASAVEVLRRGILNGDINVANQKTADRAVQTAVDGASRSGLDVSSRRIRVFMDLVVAAGLTSVSSFGLAPWESFLVGIGGSALAEYTHVSRAAASRIGAKRRLTELAKGPGGRVTPLLPS